MHRKPAQAGPDARIAALAARQHGVVNRAQLAKLGIADGAVDGRIRAGRLHRVHRGVYAVGHPLLTREGRFMAAVLACGKGATLSHISAAVLWRLLRDHGSIAHVTVPTRAGRAARQGISLHRAVLGDHEVTRVAGIRVTTPARTLLDLAGLVPLRTLERAIGEAEYLRLDCTGLAARPGRAGSRALRHGLERHSAGPTRTRSDLEECLLGLCARHGLPRPEVNATVEGYEVDFLWRGARLIVETDGRAAHQTGRAFEHDRRRDAELIVRGWRVIRITHARLTREPSAVGEQLRALLTA